MKTKKQNQIEVRTNLPVDSGTMAIIRQDNELLVNQQKIEEKIKKGVVIKMEINEPQKVVFQIEAFKDVFKEINLKKGVYYLSDPCYIIKQDKWLEVLRKTNHFEEESENLKLGLNVLRNFGGDGIHTVKVAKVI